MACRLRVLSRGERPTNWNEFAPCLLTLHQWLGQACMLNPAFGSGRGRHVSNLPDPKERAAAFIDSLPGNSILSKTGVLTTAAALAAIAVSKEFYVLNDESVLVLSGIGLVYFIGRLGGPAYREFADGYINRMKSIFHQAKSDHTQAVKDRIQSVSEMKSVVEITKDLFAVSKETADLEKKTFELEQRVKLVTEAKTVLDSWVRYETNQKQRQQQEIAKAVSQKIMQDLKNPKLQQQILQQSIAEVERIVTAKV